MAWVHLSTGKAKAWTSKSEAAMGYVIRFYLKNQTKTVQPHKAKQLQTQQLAMLSLVFFLLLISSKRWKSLVGTQQPSLLLHSIISANLGQGAALKVAVCYSAVRCAGWRDLATYLSSFVHSQGSLLKRTMLTGTVWEITSTQQKFCSHKTKHLPSGQRFFFSSLFPPGWL